ncbi:KTSC domain-containing protein [Haladaptatus pallidirubidus]|uniref:KTSC domain-containing protein n=1 Tax=Haladaptatus pallidirubidus TaxID=1008152 RepID=UPI0035E55833
MPNQQPISALESTPDEIRVNLGEWVRVQSSNIHRVSYSKFDQVLAIEFHGGREYWYRGVPESIWEGLQLPLRRVDIITKISNGTFHTCK